MQGGAEEQELPALTSTVRVTEEGGLKPFPTPSAENTIIELPYFSSYPRSVLAFPKTSSPVAATE